MQVSAIRILVSGKNLYSISFYMADKQYLERLLISNNSVAGAVALVLLLLSSLSAQPNHHVYSSQILLFLTALIW